MISPTEKSTLKIFQISGNAGTGQEETAPGEKWRQNQVGNDAAFVHHSRSVGCNETPGPEADPIDLCGKTSGRIPR